MCESRALHPSSRICSKAHSEMTKTCEALWSEFREHLGTEKANDVAWNRIEQICIGRCVVLTCGEPRLLDLAP